MVVKVEIEGITLNRLPTVDGKLNKPDEGHWILYYREMPLKGSRGAYILYDRIGATEVQINLKPNWYGLKAELVNNDNSSLPSPVVQEVSFKVE